MLATADLSEAGTLPNGDWQSNPWIGTWIGYLASVELTLEHGLGRIPCGVLVYISFFEDGARAALAAGDLARIVEVSEQTVTIQNGTREDYFVRVVLR